MIIVEKISFLKRLKSSLISMSILAYMIIIFICALAYFYMEWTFVLLSLIFIIPKIYETYIYIYIIELSNGNIVLTYYKFSKKKQLIVPCDFLSIVEYDIGPKTASSFQIISYDGITYKKIIKQYKIGAWTKEENMLALKKMIENKKTVNETKENYNK